MLPGWLIALVSAAYLGLLFVVARFADARADAGRSVISANVYALSLAVFCTTWTYYGSVGRAASGGLAFLPVYLGPTLVFLFSTVVLKMIRISKTLRITSIADFVASRYGKSQRLAVLVTLIAVIGVVPYIALQLKAVSASLNILFQRSPGSTVAWWGDSTLAIAALMALFAILFGTRHLDTTERHEGMVAAVAFESLVKLLAFAAVGLFVVYGLFDGFADLFRQAAAQPDLLHLLELDSSLSASWFSVLLLSAFAVLFLPRQFQIAVVENVDESHLRRALWVFPLYLLAINIFVLPLALGGALFFRGQGVDADTFVLTLPYSQGQYLLALLAFIGGLSAATGMLIVETIALSTMVCNDLVMPFLLRRERFQAVMNSDYSGLLLRIRRVAIALILLLGYLYFRLAGEAKALVGIGLISFAAVAQFAPAILGGTYWKAGTRDGAMAGLTGGFLIWLYTLLLPSFAHSGWIDRGFVEQGLFGLGWLKAQALFGLSGLDEVSHCLFWSLFVNLGLYLLVSSFTRQTALEASQANKFVDIFRYRQSLLESRLWRGSASSEELVRLMERFLGVERTRRLLAAYGRTRGEADWRKLPADAEFVQFAETRLAGAIGSASARVMVGSMVEEEALGVEEVLDILDEASQVRAYSRELEKKSHELEAATAELTRANTRLLELDRMKDDFISTVSHELRTPLTAIRSLSETLHDDPDIEADDRQRLTAIVIAESERLSRLIDQILDMAKIRSGQEHWRLDMVDLSAVVREALASMQQILRDKGVQMRAILPAGGPVVLADRDRLMQVLLNLISNAVKFVPVDAGRVEVRLLRSAGEVRLEIEDNGPGVALAEIDAIFERFRQGGNTLTDKPQGTGLGLAISREIIQAFGGRLWVEAATERGARFVFVLPLAPEETVHGT